MSRIEKTYTFKGFGFDVLLKNIEILEAHGEEYPNINMNQLKVYTAKVLLQSRERLTGFKLKFLRTFLKLSYQKLADIVDVPASTLKSWEDRGKEATGFSVPQERQFRLFSIESILNMEKQSLEKQIVMAEDFDMPTYDTPLDIGDRSFAQEA